MRRAGGTRARDGQPQAGGSGWAGEAAYHDRVDGVVDPAIDAGLRCSTTSTPISVAAVTAESRLVAVIAGAGSGKTRVLTRRVAYRIAHRIRRCPPHARAHLHPGGCRRAAPPAQPIGDPRTRRGRHVPLGDARRPQAALGRHRSPAEDRRRRPPSTASAMRSTPSARRSLDALPRARSTGPSARGIDADALRRRRPGARSADPPPASRPCAAAYASYETLKRRRGVIDFDDVLAHTIRELRVRDPTSPTALRWRFRHVLVDEAQDLNPLQHRLVDLLRAGTRRPVPRRRSGAGDLRVQRCRSDPARRRRDPLPRRRDHPPADEPPLHARRSCSAGLHVLDVSGQPTTLVSSRADGPVVERSRARPTRRTRRGASPASSPRATPRWCAPARSACSSARTPRSPRSPMHSGRRRRRSAAAPARPARRCRPWSARSPRSDRRRNCGRGPTTPSTRRHRHRCDRSTPLRRRRATSTDRVAGRHAVLDFLREQPLGDGADFRAWVATTNPFDDGTTGGVEVLTFHAVEGP